MQQQVGGFAAVGSVLREQLATGERPRKQQLNLVEFAQRVPSDSLVCHTEFAWERREEEVISS